MNKYNILKFVVLYPTFVNVIYIYHSDEWHRH